jgi:hypothetical protein
MSTVTPPYPNPGVALFETLDTWIQSFLLIGSDPEPNIIGGFQFEQNQVIPAFTPVGLNARNKLVPATVVETSRTFVANAAVAAGGSGGTPGPVTLAGTTGTGTRVQALGVISAAY